MAQREIQHIVEQAVDELPEAFRIVFITRVIEGMNVEETAELLDIKPETVKTRLHRARTMLRANVEKKIGPVVMEAFPFAGKRCARLTDAVLGRLGLTDNREPIPRGPSNPVCHNHRPAIFECGVTGVSRIGGNDRLLLPLPSQYESQADDRPVACRRQLFLVRRSSRMNGNPELAVRRDTCAAIPSLRQMPKPSCQIRKSVNSSSRFSVLSSASSAPAL